MPNATLLPPATTPTTPPKTHRPFALTLGTYDAVVAAAAVQYELESLLAALQAASVPFSLVEQRLDAACVALDAANDAWMAGCPC